MTNKRGWIDCGLIVLAIVLLGVTMALQGCTTLGYSTKDGKGKERKVNVTSWRSADDIAGMVGQGADAATGFLGPIVASIAGGGLGIGGLVGILGKRASASRERVRADAEAKRAEEYNAGLLAGASARGPIAVPPTPAPSGA